MYLKYNRGGGGGHKWLVTPKYLPWGGDPVTPVIRAWHMYIMMLPSNSYGVDNSNYQFLLPSDYIK